MCFDIPLEARETLCQDIEYDESTGRSRSAQFSVATSMYIVVHLVQQW